MRAMRRTLLALALALALASPFALAGCRAGPGEFPGDYENLRFVGTFTTSGTGKQSSQNDTNVKLTVADGESGGDVVLKLTGDLACTVFGTRSGTTLALHSTTECSYTTVSKSDTFQIAVTSGDTTLDAGALTVNLTGTFVHPVMKMPDEKGGFTGKVTATKK